MLSQKPSIFVTLEIQLEKLYVYLVMLQKTSIIEVLRFFKHDIEIPFMLLRGPLYHNISSHLNMPLHAHALIHLIPS